MMKYKAVVEKRGEDYVGYFVDLPVNTQGKTVSEVKRNLRKALCLYLLDEEDK